MNRLFTSSFRRWVSNQSRQTGNIEITEKITTNAEGKQTKIIEQLTNIRQSWYSLSPITRRIIYGYASLGVIDNIYGTYNSRKSTLLEYRQDPEDFRESNFSRREIKSDWQAVVSGCNNGWFDRFIGSLVWPSGIVSRAMPSIILTLNPSNDVKTMDHQDNDQTES